MSADVDVVVIGGGHNGLIAAGLLARAGVRVRLLERAARVGGLTGGRELASGVEVPTGPIDLVGLTGLVTELGLEEHGLELIEPDVVAFVPEQQERPALSLFRDLELARRVLATRSPADADRLPGWLDRLGQWSEALERFLARPIDLPELGRMTLEPELVRAIGSSAETLLRDGLETPALHAALGWRALLGTRLGPSAVGTGLGLVRFGRGAGLTAWPERPRPRGGMGAFAAALERWLVACGGEVETGASVEAIVVEGGRVRGVRLHDGSERHARAVISTLDPRRTLLDLVGPHRLSPSVVRALRAARYRGSLARLHLVLERLPAFRGQEDESELTGEIVLAAGLDDLEQAAGDAKYGRVSERPWAVAVLPALADPSLALEDGRHLMTVTAYHAPFEACDDRGRGKLLEGILARFESVSPGFGELVVERDLTTAGDWHALGWSEGSVFHGETTLAQSFVLRNSAGLEGGATPISGLWLGGSGAPPIGGVSGLPGRFAAEAVLRAIGG